MRRTALRRALFALALLVGPAPLAAQHGWNDAAVRALVARAVAHREHAAERGLVDYEARAHGFVFFLGQLGGQGLTRPPQLIRSDELEVEVYWKAPGASKQRILGWRHRVDLPTDIVYHRDHLGIVQNGFGDRIRIGEGDEVRDVPHPLAPDGAALYDYRLDDSLTIVLPDRTVRVHAVAFRPKDPTAPRVVGTLYLDASDGALVRLRCSFTRAAYRDPTLEDIAIALENGLWNGSYWLPRRQEIEIRRGTSWLGLPARGIIRAEWTIGDYRLDVGLPSVRFLGPEIVAATRAVRDTFPWRGSLDSAIVTALGPTETVDLRQVRAQVADLVSARDLGGLPGARPAVGSLSDLLHVNRVQGFTPGFGWAVRPSDALRVEGWGAYGMQGHRAEGRLALRLTRGPISYSLSASRRVRDLAGEPVISGVLNSFLAQELGRDFGDYVLADGIDAGFAHRLGAYGALTVQAGVEWTSSVGVALTPATGAFRPNPALGAGRVVFGRLTVRAGGTDGTKHFDVAVEGGAREHAGYLVARIAGAAALSVGASRIALSGWVGWASDSVPLDRAFVFGGRGTLVGAPFRAFGGRAAALGRLEWRLPIPFPAIPLGPYAATRRQATLAPFVAAGWAGRPFSGTPWGTSDGLRPVVGVGLDVVERLLHVEAGWSPRDHQAGITVDVRRVLWPIL